MIDPALYFTDRFIAFDTWIKPCKGVKLFKLYKDIGIYGFVICYPLGLLLIIIGSINANFWIILTSFVFFHIANMNFLTYMLKDNSIDNKAFRELMYFRTEIGGGILAFYLYLISTVLIIGTVVIVGNIFVVIIISIFLSYLMTSFAKQNLEKKYYFRQTKQERYFRKILLFALQIMLIALFIIPYFSRADVYLIVLSSVCIAFFVLSWLSYPLSIWIDNQIEHSGEGTVPIKILNPFSKFDLKKIGYYYSDTICYFQKSTMNLEENQENLQEVQVEGMMKRKKNSEKLDQRNTKEIMIFTILILLFPLALIYLFVLQSYNQQKKFSHLKYVNKHPGITFYTIPALFLVISVFSLIPIVKFMIWGFLIKIPEESQDPCNSLYFEEIRISNIFEE